MLRGVDGVRTPGAANLGIRHHEMAIALGREAHHLQAMLGGRQFALGFMRRRRCGNEVDQVQLQHLANFLGRAQMPEVDGIEAAAEESYTQLMLRQNRGNAAAQLRIWPSPRTRYLYVVSSRKPIGPRAWRRLVEIPVSAPKPNSKPSVKRVDALT